MKNVSRSAYVKLRVLLAFTLCLGRPFSGGHGVRRVAGFDRCDVGSLENSGCRDAERMKSRMPAA